MFKENLIKRISDLHFTKLKPYWSLLVSNYCPSPINAPPLKLRKFNKAPALITLVGPAGLWSVHAGLWSVHAGFWSVPAGFWSVPARFLLGSGRFWSVHVLVNTTSVCVLHPSTIHHQHKLGRAQTRFSSQFSSFIFSQKLLYRARSWITIFCLRTSFGLGKYFLRYEANFIFCTQNMKKKYIRGKMPKKR